MPIHTSISSSIGNAVHFFWSDCISCFSPSWRRDVAHATAWLLVRPRVEMEDRRADAGEPVPVGVRQDARLTEDGVMFSFPTPSGVLSVLHAVGLGRTAEGCRRLLATPVVLGVARTGALQRSRTCCEAYAR